MIRAWYRMMYAGRLLYGDMHPGNFLFMDNDRLGVIDFGFVLEHTMACMNDDAADENGVGHRAPSIAALTRSACTVSATSWARIMAAPLRAATRWAASEPPRR